MSALSLSSAVVQSLILMATYHGRPGALASLARRRAAQRPHLDAFAQSWLQRGLVEWQQAQTWMAHNGLMVAIEGGGWRLTELGHALATEVLRRRPMWLLRVQRR